MHVAFVCMSSCEICLRDILGDRRFCQDNSAAASRHYVWRKIP